MISLMTTNALGGSERPFCHVSVPYRQGSVGGCNGGIPRIGRSSLCPIDMLPNQTEQNWDALMLYAREDCQPRLANMQLCFKTQASPQFNLIQLVNMQLPSIFFQPHHYDPPPWKLLDSSLELHHSASLYVMASPRTVVRGSIKTKMSGP